MERKWRGQERGGALHVHKTTQQQASALREGDAPHLSSDYHTAWLCSQCLMSEDMKFELVLSGCFHCKVSMMWPGSVRLYILFFPSPLTHL